MAEYQVLYWKDIPAQIKVFEGRRPRSHPLPDSFQDEIDRVATREGLTGTDAYLDQWHWSEKKDHPGNAAEVVEAVTEKIKSQFPDLFKEQTSD